MLSLALVVVLSQHGPKVIEVKKASVAQNASKPVPVLRQENVVRPVSSSKSVTQAGAVPKVEAAAAPAPTLGASASSSSASAAPDPQDAQSQAEHLKDQERRQQELLKRAAANEELWRSAANALAGE
jgi:hypothetical protein